MQGISIYGIPVLGTVEHLPEICESRNIEEIAIAMPSASHQQLRHVVQVCEGTKARFRTVPSITDIASGKFRVSQIRDVDINDLLGREAVQLDLDLIEAFAKDKTILVTGAGGSIGSELCRQVAHRQPKRLVLLGHGEYSIYLIHEELRSQFPKLELVPVIADVRDKARLQRVFRAHCPEVVFHAAAHKHVPLMEQNLDEAVTNNVLGTRNVLEVAAGMDVERFVLISSDKAVNPVNVMGATKRIAELMAQDASRQAGRNFVAVRFGNVLGSRGSVVPLFKQQIQAGGPVTVTHPDMERYFMTIPEAVYLVLQAAALGQGGELFVLDMGEPVKIVDLARDLITLSGLQPGRDIEIKFVGMRSGEKLRERLFLEGEEYETTSHDKVFVFKGQLSLKGNELRRAVQRLVQLAQQGAGKAEIWTAVQAIVPECKVDLDPRATSQDEPHSVVDRRMSVASAT